MGAAAPRVRVEWALHAGLEHARGMSPDPCSRRGFSPPPTFAQAGGAQIRRDMLGCMRGGSSDVYMPVVPPEPQRAD